MAQLAGTRNIMSILKTSQQKAISTGLLTFALIVALLWGSFRPTILTILDTNRKHTERQQLLERLRTQNTNITALLNARVAESKKFEELDYYFPHDGDYSLFIVNLHLIAKKYELKLEGVSFSSSYFRQVERMSVLQYPEMTPATFQVTLKGDPANLSQFFTYLESTPFLPKVLNISYSPNRNNAKETTSSATLLLYKMTAPAFGQ